jgi:uncharacterized damage-inducible protein DinB
LLPQLRSEQATTRKILLAVPPGRESYRPHPNSRSAFELARHIAITEIWFLDAVFERRFGETLNPGDSVRTCRDMANWYAENVGPRMLQLEELSGEDLATPVDWLGLRQDPAVAYLNIAILHSVRHRGQLSARTCPQSTWKGATSLFRRSTAVFLSNRRRRFDRLSSKRTLIGSGFRSACS